jgi:hypothetical protein
MLNVLNEVHFCFTSGRNEEENIQMLDARIMDIYEGCAKGKSCHLRLDILLIESVLIMA